MKNKYRYVHLKTLKCCFRCQSSLLGHRRWLQPRRPIWSDRGGPLLMLTWTLCRAEGEWSSGGSNCNITFNILLQFPLLWCHILWWIRPVGRSFGETGGKTWAEGQIVEEIQFCRAFLFKVSEINSNEWIVLSVILGLLWSVGNDGQKTGGWERGSCGILFRGWNCTWLDVDSKFIAQQFEFYKSILVNLTLVFYVLFLGSPEVIPIGWKTPNETDNVFQAEPGWKNPEHNWALGRKPPAGRDQRRDSPLPVPV